MAEVKLAVIYPRPKDVESFEKVYTNERVPLAAAKLGGKTKIVATKVLGSVSKSVQFEGGKAHLAGVSNDGLSAYRVITEYPGRFLSLTVLPGVPPDERAFNAFGRLQGIAVAAFVGGADLEWVRRSRETKRKLDSLGIENALEIVAGAGHVVPLDPTKLFDLLDRRRPKNVISKAR